MPAAGRNVPFIRPARDDDGDALAALIAACFAEYPGCLFDRALEFPELDAIATHFRTLGGMIWVANEGEAIIGSLGLKPADHDGVEVVKAYVARDWRGRGLAAALLAHAFEWARAGGARRVELWTDTRFERAHAFYRKAGFTPTGQIRDLADISNSSEFRFVRALEGANDR